MKVRPDLNKLSKEVFEANKAKVFHDEERSNETLLMLVITELSEAVEADRKNRKASDNLKKHNTCIASLEFDKILFERLVKDTVEDELADAIIRLLDLAGLRGCDHLKDLLLLLRPTVSDKKSFVENIFATTVNLVYYKYSISERISYALLNIEYLAKILSIDLWQHVELKLKYNATRPHKHGKKY